MDWFNETGYPFMMFTPQHLIPLACIALLILLLYRFRKPLQQDAPVRAIRIGLSLLLLVFEALLYGWYIYYGQFSLEASLPLQLCSIGYLLTIVMLLFPSHRLYEFLS